MEDILQSNIWCRITLVLIGVFCGVMATTSIYAQFSGQAALGNTNIQAAMYIVFGILGAAVMHELHNTTHKVIKRLSLSDNTQIVFHKYHILTYFIFLGCGLMLVGIEAKLSFAIFLLVLFILAQVVLLIISAEKSQKDKWLKSLDAVPFLFFISGFAALIYQVVWQRVLFSTFGTNIESVTVIVSVFMFGLGLGSLIGGQVQKYFPNRLLECFVAIEIAIGIFGIFSIPLIYKVGEMVPHDSLPTLVLATFSLLAFPTMLMGSTLPFLVAYLQRQTNNLGVIVGKLYAYNTLGSSLASFITVMLLFTVMGRQSTLFVAAMCNVVTAYLVWICCKNNTVDSVYYDVSKKEYNAGNILPDSSISLPLALFLSCMVGYASLSLEIIWFRIIGFMTEGLPQVFGTLLAVFLAGIAYGSLKAKDWSESCKDPREFMVRGLLIMVVIAYFSVPLVGVSSEYIHKYFGTLLGYVAVGMIAFFSGGVFPMLCQICGSAHGKHSAVAVSWVYFSNIIGATLGSFITGFVLFDRLDLEWNVALVCVIIIFSLILLTRRQYKVIACTGFAVALLVLFIQPVIYQNIIFNLQSKTKKTSLLVHVNENRHGIITTFKSKGGDFIFGNGAYDGRFNIDPVVNSNKITRAYQSVTLHPNPKRILELGLSGGAWARAITFYKPLQELVSIEINPGYLEVIKNYPEVSPVLHSAKWTNHIDDGRRWLNNNPDEKFDIIIMNTIYYWRSNSTNLLSYEFLELCKKHLNKGGVLFYNSTGAMDNYYTAAHLFKHIGKIDSMVIAGDEPLDVPADIKRRNLLGFENDNGKTIFSDNDPNYSSVRENLVNQKIEDMHDELLQRKDLWLITDDNMSSEYKINNSFMPPFWYTGFPSY